MVQSHYRNSGICNLSFEKLGPCVYKNIDVNVFVERVSSDEALIKELIVVNQGKTFTLEVTEDTTMLKADRGHISFADINFDAAPDIAITTSFGLANLYIWEGFELVKK